MPTRAYVPMDWVITANSLSAGLRRADFTLCRHHPEEGIARNEKGAGKWLELFETLDELQGSGPITSKLLSGLRVREQIWIIDGMAAGEVAAKSGREQLSLPSRNPGRFRCAPCRPPLRNTVQPAGLAGRKLTAMANWSIQIKKTAISTELPIRTIPPGKGLEPGQTKADNG